jgi:siderophore synthetase component
LSDTIVPGDPIARERIDALSLRLTEQIAAQKDRVQIALDAAEKAVAKAEVATERRLEGLNELRGLVSDQQARFATTEIMDAKFDAVEARLSLLERQSATDKGRQGLSTPLLLTLATEASAVFSGVVVYVSTHLAH